MATRNDTLRPLQEDRADLAERVDSQIGVLSPVEVQQRIASARNGAQNDLGELLESCRNYLLLIANLAIKPGLQSKVGASDLVQETLFEAQQIFDRFTGSTQADLQRWMARILENKIGNTLKRYFGTARRNLKLERGWFQDCDGPESAVPVACQGMSPSAICQLNEDLERYHQVLASLPEDQQEVIRLRVDEELRFEAIGQRMNRTAEAARQLYARTIIRIQNLLDTEHDQRR